MVSADLLGTGGTVYFTYDAAGQRVRKVWEHNALIEERIYLGGAELYRKRQQQGQNWEVVLERKTLHVMDDERRIALVETKTIDTSVPPFQPSPVIRFQLGNHLGSSMLEVDEFGLVISYEEYHPYGTTAYCSGTSAAEVSRKRYRYTGKEQDEETGLYYHGARYYAPWLGRWTSADPAGMVDGPDLYRYVKGNPVRSIDPSGMQDKPVVPTPAPAPGMKVPNPPPPKTVPPRKTDEKPAPPPPDPAPTPAPGEEVTVLVAGHKTSATRFSQRNQSAAEQAQQALLRERDDKNFSNRVKILEPLDLQQAGYTGKIVKGDAKTGAELFEILKTASKEGPIKNLVIYAHVGGGIIMKEDVGLYPRKGDVFGNKAVRERMKAEGLTEESLVKGGLRDVSDLSAAIAKGEIKFAKDAMIIIVGCGGCGSTGVSGSSLAPTLAKATADVNAMVVGTWGGSDQAKLEKIVGTAAATSGRFEFAPQGWYAFSGTTGEAKQLTAEQLGSTDERVLRTSTLLTKRPDLTRNK
jgi:RHS repeat-associated protein